MSKSGLFSGTVTESSPATGSLTTKHKGHHFMQWGAAIPVPSFILVFFTGGADENIELPLVHGWIYDFTVDWGDGHIDHITDWAQPEKIHTYADAGQHTVTIDGRLEAWQYPQLPVPLTLHQTTTELSGGEPALASTVHNELVEIKQWGSVGFRMLQGAFRGCKNLTITATDAPDLSTVTSLALMFQDSDVSGFFVNWDTSTITNMTSMFYNCPTFNEDISGWNVSNVTSFGIMFANDVLFNQDLSGWNMDSASYLGWMFYNCEVLSAGNLGGWTTSNFRYCNWMFYGCDAFNHDLSLWDMSGVVSISEMFAHSNYNQDISGWDVGNVTDMSWLFSANSQFNHDIGNWNTANCIDMDGVFFSATAFNYDISRWDISKVTTIGGFMADATGFSTSNYDLLLNGWSSRPVKPEDAVNNMRPSFAANYTIIVSQAGRDILTNAPNHWDIHDLGGV